MERIQFICELLTDVILNTKAVSGSDNQTLDFIPGNCFLGIVAKALYKETSDEKMNEEMAMLFHSGAVRFGDAHPLCDGIRTLRIPASYYSPKIEKTPFYLYHKVDSKDAELRKKQLKQCREGFYAFDDEKKTIKECKPKKNYLIKSAYDTDKLCSERGGMYGYESLQKGMSFAFDVEIDDCALGLKGEIVGALRGEHGVGRSRTAQYGRVKILEEKYDEVNSATEVKKELFVYADGRLIFLDRYGIPTFCPEAKDLGIEDGKINWGKSQIRTFQYAPWNGKRQAFDADRCGIEKGSVFCVELCDDAQVSDFGYGYVGVYKNEGFGRVLYNPKFLQSNTVEVQYQFVKDGKENNDCNKLDGNDTILLKYLKRQKKKQEDSSRIYKLVNDFKKNHKSDFSSETFASQWGQIRSTAMQKKSYDEIQKGLFAEKDGYLTHGVCADKWRGKRLKILGDFLAENRNIAKELLIKLASEMQKLN